MCLVSLMFSKMRKCLVGKDLFEGLPVFGNRLEVVAADAEVEEFATPHRTTTVAVVDVLPTPNDVGNGVAGKVNGFDAGMRLLDVLDNRWFFGMRCRLEMQHILFSLWMVTHPICTPPNVQYNIGKQNNLLEY